MRAAAGSAARPNRLLRPADVRLRPWLRRAEPAAGQGPFDCRIYLLRSGLPGIFRRPGRAERPAADHQQRHLVRPLNWPAAALADGADARPGSRPLDDPRDQQRRHRADRPTRPDHHTTAAVRTGGALRPGATDAGAHALSALARLADADYLPAAVCLGVAGQPYG